MSNFNIQLKYDISRFISLKIHYGEDFEITKSFPKEETYSTDQIRRS
jgi:hypothetical protein